MRSVKPTDYAEAFRYLQGVDFYSPQINAQRDVDEALRINDVTGEFESFDDTAAFIEGLDLVITVCTSIALFAGRARRADMGSARRQSSLGMDDWLRRQSLVCKRRAVSTTGVRGVGSVLASVTHDLRRC